jgi:hypothetical protein
MKNTVNLTKNDLISTKFEVSRKKYDDVVFFGITDRIRTKLWTEIYKHEFKIDAMWWSLYIRFGSVEPQTL